MDKLTARPAPYGTMAQALFEDTLSTLGIKQGTLAISEDGTRYLNEHIQWLWEQYARG